MNTQKTDKSLSGFLIVLTIAIIFYAMNSEGVLPKPNGKPLNETLEYLFTFYLDFILIGYVFICLQISGYLELKYKKDFLTMSIVCILFTPFSIFFIFKKEDKNE